MAAEEGKSGAARLRLLCSHGGRLVPSGRDGALRYVGGETRALVVPRDVTFRELAARLAEKAGAGAGAVTAFRYRLADEGLDDVLVSVTCDDELAYMRDEYDRLKATRPSASFRVIVRPRRRDPGLPPLAPRLRRAQSEQALAGSRPCPAGRAGPAAPMRRVHSAHELAQGRSHLQPFVYRHRDHCCCFCCFHHRRDVCAAVPQPARPTRPVPSMSKNVDGARPGGPGAAPAMSTATGTSDREAFPKKPMEKARCRDAVAAMVMVNRACWEFE